MKWSILTYSLTLIFLVIYSYTQVDLNLTLFVNPTYLSIQKALTYIGYFDRPVSASIFVVLLALLLVHYGYFLKSVLSKKLPKSDILKLLGISAALLFVSYPAFSHDIFNYIFDARIIGTYGLNPYDYKALDFPDDTWTRFMHWTHRTYPYGPAWVLLTLPFYLFGLGKFVLTLLSFKLLFTLSYVGCLFFIYKIVLLIKKDYALIALVWFGLNPLILIETLISPHNDSIMLFFTLASLFLILKNKVVGSLVGMVAAGAIKFISWAYLPIIFFIKKDKNNFEKYNKILLVLTALLLVPVVHARELYPWYLIPLIGLGSLITRENLIKAALIGVSIGALLQYVPYLYTGEYNDELRRWQIILALIPTLSLPFIFWLRQLNGKMNKRS